MAEFDDLLNRTYQKVLEARRPHEERRWAADFRRLLGALREGVGLTPRKLAKLLDTKPRLVQMWIDEEAVVPQEVLTYLRALAAVMDAAPLEEDEWYRRVTSPAPTLDQTPDEPVGSVLIAPGER